jgi:hypothetical protein
MFSPVPPLPNNEALKGAIAGTISITLVLTVCIVYASSTRRARLAAEAKGLVAVHAPPGLHSGSDGDSLSNGVHGRPNPLERVLGVDSNPMQQKRRPPGPLGMQQLHKQHFAIKEAQRQAETQARLSQLQPHTGVLDSARRRSGVGGGVNASIDESLDFPDDLMSPKIVLTHHNPASVFAPAGELPNARNFLPSAMPMRQAPVQASHAYYNNPNPIDPRGQYAQQPQQQHSGVSPTAAQLQAAISRQSLQQQLQGSPRRGAEAVAPNNNAYRQQDIW